MNTLDRINIQRCQKRILYATAKSAQPIDDYDDSIKKDEKGVYYYKGKRINTPELVEAALYYGEGIVKRLPKEERASFIAAIWKAIPNKWHITIFGGRGVVTDAVKNGKNIDVFYRHKDKPERYDALWYLKYTIADSNDLLIFSKDAAPKNIRYSDIKNSFGKLHIFKVINTAIPEGKKIEYEDDLVAVFDKNGKEIYKGLEDDEPMRYENWKWDSYNRYYTLDDEYIKVCLL